MPHPANDHAFDGPANPLDAFLHGPAAVQKATQSLKRIARAVLLDDNLAEDVVQDAWVELIEHPSSESKGAGWLRTLVRSRSIDALRRRSRRPRSLEFKEDDPPAGEDELAARLDVQRKVLEAVEALEEPYRSTVFLRYFEGLGPKKISARQGVPEKTVKNRLTRGHALLRERLAPAFQENDGRWSPGILAFSGLTVPEAAAPLAIPVATFAMKKIALFAFLALALVSSWHFARRTAQPSENSASTAFAPASNPERTEREKAALSDAGVLHSPRAAAVAPQTITGPPLQSPSVHGSLRVAVLHADGSPAAQVHVVASTHPDESRLTRQFRQTTDEDGMAWFPKLPAGAVQLKSDRLQKEERTLCKIEIDVATEATLHLLPGVHVAGHVLDDRKLPVPRAAIWLTADLSGWTGGGVVTRADETGYFELEDVPPDQSIGALAPGYRPSELVDLDLQDKSVHPVLIQLQLVPGGTQLSGMVTDELGLPIENALVVVGEMASMVEIREDDSSMETWTPQSTRTDERGRYRFDSLHPETTTIQARSIDHALWTGDVTLHSEIQNTFNIQLRRSVSVRGQVSYPDGSAAPKTVVMAFGNQLDEIFLQGGQVNDPGTLAYPVTISDEEGRYVLKDVEPGETWLYAMEQRKNRYAFDEMVKYTKEELHLPSNTESEWNPVLSDGRVIEGHAYYSDGAKIEGVFAILEGEGEEYRAARVKEDGFRFTNLGEGPYTVRIQMWEKPSDEGDPYLEGIVPGGGPIEVLAEFPAPVVMEPANVHVRLNDSGERSTGSARVVIARGDRYRNIEGEANDELWEFQIDEPGTYRAVALQGKRVIAQGEFFQIEGGEDFELEPLVTLPAGSLLLRIDRPLDHSTGNLLAFVRSLPEGHTESFSIEGQIELRLDNMEPGAGLLRVEGEHVAGTRLEYEIRSGEETVLEVPLIPAVAVKYEIRWPISKAKSTLHVRFMDRGTGLVAHEVEIDSLAPFVSPMQWTAMLTPGQYLYEVKMNGTVTTREEFEVSSLDPYLAPRLGED